jgi:ABC-type Na+ transport system ATPase subunit NatA
MEDGKVILLVGQRGCGKTTFIRDLIKGVNREALFIHDVGGNFRDLYDKPNLKIDDFKKSVTNVKEAVIVFEEATIFFNHSPQQDTTDFLVTSRYRKNTIFFVFHSVRKLPWFILDLSDYIILFKTKDKPSVIAEKFEDENINEIYTRVNASPDKYAFEQFEL